MKIKNGYPLPRIDNIFDQISRAKYITKIDLRSGYHQVRLDHASNPLTTFRTRYGLFEFLVLPFGLTNAPATFMSLMNEIFKEHLDHFVIVYLDGILFYSRNIEDYIKQRCIALEILRKNILFRNMSKYTFAASKVEYLGQTLTSSSVSMDPDKITSILDWPCPENKKDVQSFLGLVNYYRRFIRNCSKIVKPLIELTKNVEFSWNTKKEHAFQALKKYVSSAPLLQTFEPRRKAVVTTDASQYAIGAVLDQLSELGPRPVAFASRTLQPAEQNYAAHERELLAIVDTLRVWRPYFHGTNFVVHTDHYPLKYLQTQEHLSPRKVGWQERIDEFAFQVIPISGKSDVVADALSRKPKDIPKTEEHNRTLLTKAIAKTAPSSVLLHNISFTCIESSTLRNLARDYENDPEFKDNYLSPSTVFTREKSLLYRNAKLCVPKGKFRLDFLFDHH